MTGKAMNTDEPKLPPRMPRFGHNICGVFVQVRPEFIESVVTSLKALPGVEVHHVEGDGRIVVTAEDGPGHAAANAMTDIHNIKGVLSASLVYHHCETDPISEDQEP